MVRPNVVNKLKNMGNDIKSFLFEDDVNYISPLEEIGVVLYINGIILTIVFSLIFFISYLINIFPIKFPLELKVLPWLWILLAGVNMLLAEKYIRERKEKDIKLLFWGTLLMLLTAAGFLLPGILMLIGTYFVYEAHLRK